MWGCDGGDMAWKIRFRGGPLHLSVVRIASSGGSRRAHFSNGAGCDVFAEIVHRKRRWRDCVWTCVAASLGVYGFVDMRVVSLCLGCAMASRRKDVAGATGNCVCSDTWGGREQSSDCVCRRIIGRSVCVVSTCLDHDEGELRNTEMISENWIGQKHPFWDSHAICAFP